MSLTKRLEQFLGYGLEKVQEEVGIRVVPNVEVALFDGKTYPDAINALGDRLRREAIMRCGMDLEKDFHASRSGLNVQYEFYTRDRSMKVTVKGRLPDPTYTTHEELYGVPARVGSPA